MTVRIHGRTLASWRTFAACRLHITRCRHPLYAYRYSRRRRHPDGRGETYSRCAVCLRVLWRAWDTYPFGRHRFSVGAWIVRRRYLRAAMAKPPGGPGGISGHDETAPAPGP